MSDHATVGIGIIGAGAMARAYCECLSRHTSGARLVAVSGGTRAPALAEKYRVSADATVEAMLDRPEIGAVVIATPEMRHLEQALLAAEKGKHILVEKPMAKDVAPCDAMIARCDKAGVGMMVCHHWRFRGPPHRPGSHHDRAYRDRIEGDIGRVRGGPPQDCRGGQVGAGAAQVRAHDHAGRTPGRSVGRPQSDPVLSRQRKIAPPSLSLRVAAFNAENFYLQAARKDPNFENNGSLIKAALARLLSGDVSGALAGMDGRVDGLESAVRLVRRASEFNLRAQFFLWGVLFRPVELQVGGSGGRPSFRPAFTFFDIMGRGRK